MRYTSFGVTQIRISLYNWRSLHYIFSMPGHAEPSPAPLALDLCQKRWLLNRPQSLESLWENMSVQDFADERIPYWTELWPASLGLARWLCMRQAQIAGKLCLDLGCGLGFTAMTAKFLGARVLACDYEPEALAAARANAHANAIDGIDWLCMDWRQGAVKPHSIALIWAADILYEERSMAPVLRFIDVALAPGGRAWIAEPGRAIFHKFINLAREEGWRIEKAHGERVKPADTPTVEIGIWELTRPG